MIRDNQKKVYATLLCIYYLLVHKRRVLFKAIESEKIVSQYTGRYGNAKKFKKIRAKALMTFASTQVDVLRSMWSAFYVAIDLPFEDALLSQMINSRVFDNFPSKRRSVSIDSSAVPFVGMSVDERKGVRYAAVFVPFCLIKKYIVHVVGITFAHL